MSALPKKIAVLMGGPGSERDVSIATGTGAAKALRSLGIDVVEVDVKDPDFELSADIAPEKRLILLASTCLMTAAWARHR